MAKPTEVVQKETETPTEFYERLCKTYRLYTPIDPEAAWSQIVINTAFVSQAYPDIRQTPKGKWSISHDHLTNN